MTPGDAVRAGAYEAGDPTRGSRFGRGLMTSLNQVPMLGYFALAAVLAGAAYLSYRSANKGK